MLSRRGIPSRREFLQAAVAITGAEFGIARSAAFLQPDVAFVDVDR